MLRPEDALVEDYRAFRKRVGTSRNVVVQPSTYGIDNRVTLAAVAAFGPQARAVVVVNDTVSDGELKRIIRTGSARHSLQPGDGRRDDARDDRAVGETDQRTGWHIQINALAAKIIEIMPILEKVPSQIVFDHLAHIPEPEGVNDPLFGKVRALIDKEKTWVKLSGAYQDTKVGPPTYADSTAVAQAYAKGAPERCVWGSDWPHPGEREKKPDDAVLFDLLLVWAPGEKVRHRILVENPAVLYDYPKSV